MEHQYDDIRFNPMYKSKKEIYGQNNEYDLENSSRDGKWIQRSKDSVGSVIQYMRQSIVELFKCQDAIFYERNDKLREEAIDSFNDLLNGLIEGLNSLDHKNTFHIQKLQIFSAHMKEKDDQLVKNGKREELQVKKLRKTIEQYKENIKKRVEVSEAVFTIASKSGYSVQKLIREYREGMVELNQKDIIPEEVRRIHESEVNQHYSQFTSKNIDVLTESKRIQEIHFDEHLLKLVKLNIGEKNYSKIESLLKSKIPKNEIKKRIEDLQKKQIKSFEKLSKTNQSTQTESQHFHRWSYEVGGSKQNSVSIQTNFDSPQSDGEQITNCKTIGVQTTENLISKELTTPKRKKLKPKKKGKDSGLKSSRKPKSTQSKDVVRQIGDDDKKHTDQQETPRTENETNLNRNASPSKQSKPQDVLQQTDSNESKTAGHIAMVTDSIENASPSKETKTQDNSPPSDPNASINKTVTEKEKHDTKLSPAVPSEESQKKITSTKENSTQDMDETGENHDHSMGKPSNIERDKEDVPTPSTIQMGKDEIRENNNPTDVSGKVRSKENTDSEPIVNEVIASTDDIGEELKTNIGMSHENHSKEETENHVNTSTETVSKSRISQLKNIHTSKSSNPSQSPITPTEGKQKNLEDSLSTTSEVSEWQNIEVTTTSMSLDVVQQEKSLENECAPIAVVSCLTRSKKQQKAQNGPKNAESRRKRQTNLPKRRKSKQNKDDLPRKPKTKRKNASTFQNDIILSDQDESDMTIDSNQVAVEDFGEGLEVSRPQSDDEEETVLKNEQNSESKEDLNKSSNQKIGVTKGAIPSGKQVKQIPKKTLISPRIPQKKRTTVYETFLTQKKLEKESKARNHQEQPKKIPEVLLEKPFVVDVENSSKESITPREIENKDSSHKNPEKGFTKEKHCKGKKKKRKKAKVKKLHIIQTPEYPLLEQSSELDEMGSLDLSREIDVDSKTFEELSSDTNSEQKKKKRSRKSPMFFMDISHTNRPKRFTPEHKHRFDKLDKPTSSKLSQKDIQDLYHIPRLPIERIHDLDENEYCTETNPDSWIEDTNAYTNANTYADAPYAIEDPPHANADSIPMNIPLIDLKLGKKTKSKNDSDKKFRKRKSNHQKLHQNPKFQKHLQARQNSEKVIESIIQERNVKVLKKLMNQIEKILPEKRQKKNELKITNYKGTKKSEKQFDDAPNSVEKQTKQTKKESLEKDNVSKDTNGKERTPLNGGVHDLTQSIPKVKMQPQMFVNTFAYTPKTPLKKNSFSNRFVHSTNPKNSTDDDGPSVTSIPKSRIHIKHETSDIAMYRTPYNERYKIRSTPEVTAIPTQQLGELEVVLAKASPRRTNEDQRKQPQQPESMVKKHLSTFNHLYDPYSNLQLKSYQTTKCNAGSHKRRHSEPVNPKLNVVSLGLLDSETSSPLISRVPNSKPSVGDKEKKSFLQKGNENFTKEEESFLKEYRRRRKSLQTETKRKTTAKLPKIGLY